MDINSKVRELPWERIKTNLTEQGYASIPKLIPPGLCDELIEHYSNDALYRKTVNMERHRFGKGEYKYYDYPLPYLVQELRETVYSNLAPIANEWMKMLNIDTKEFPDHHQDFLNHCDQNHQQQPTPLILKYEEGGYNTLHQDLYGSVYFPLQLAIFLSDYEDDYSGGEFVLTEQIPRSQSKAIVLKPKKGDALIFATNFRPVKGNRGYYRANMRHGVSEVKEGNRYTLGVIFHDATS